MADGFNIQEWILKAKDDPKVAAQPVVVLLALILLAYRFLYVPQKTTLTKELKKSKAVKDQIRSLESAVANIEEIKIEVNDLRKSWSEVETKCYQKSEAPLFLQDLRNVAKLASLTVRNIAPLPPESRTFETLTYEIYPVRISFAGELKQLGVFLHYMAKNPKIIFLDLPNLVPDASGAFKFDLVPATILLPNRPKPDR